MNNELRLGDIIRVSSSSTELDEKVFLIEYIDISEIHIKNKDIKEIIRLRDGNILNEDIRNIYILSRSEELGYAKQNGLNIGLWINIHVGGDLPQIYTGKITNIEEDQIEIILLNEEVIYIDFAYQGIPRDLNIETIEIREQPKSLKSDEKESPLIDEDVVENVDEGADIENEYVEDGNAEEGAVLDWAAEMDEYDMDEGEVKFEIADDEIIFGDDLEEIEYQVDLPDELKKYSLDKQIDDLLDDLLSTIPTEKRTQKVMTKLHTMIERFIQLRVEFTNINSKGESVIKETIGDYSFLKENILTMNKKIDWLLPVTKMNKKIYNDVGDLEIEDCVFMDFNSELRNEYQLNRNYEEYKVSEDNLYHDYLRRLSPFYKPYADYDITEPHIYNVTIKNNITSVVSNDNDFNTYVIKNDKIGQKRMFLQEYVTGDKNISRNDSMYLHSLMVLPETLINASYKNIMGSYLSTKIASRYIYKYEYLNSKTLTQDIVLDGMNENLFGNSILYYPNTEPFQDYIEKVIPSNYNLFKTYINQVKDENTTYDIYKKLEVFSIDKSNIIKEIANEAEHLIQDNITRYNIDISNKQKDFELLNNTTRQTKSVFEGILKDEELKKHVMEAYSIENEMIQYSELMHKISLDNGKVFLLALVIDNNNLLLDFEFPELTLKENQDAPCEKYIISKRYTTLEKLEEDNDKIIFFDKEYDDTYYDIIKEYNFDGLTDKETYLKEELIKKNGMNPEDAERYAETLLKGIKDVKNGDYAVYLNGKEHSFFIRNENKWVPSDVSPDVFSDNTKMLCNLKDTCFVNHSECITETEKQNKLNEKLYHDIISSFEKDIHMKSEELKQKIDYLFKLSSEHIQIIKENTHYEEIKNDLIHYDYGMKVKENMFVKSPYQNLRDKILGQNDFVKKQNDILKFVQLYTRPHKENEDEYWKYCTTSNVKLLPVFIETLSNVYLTNPDRYIYKLQEIMTLQGQLSDDGDMIVDKHSGYIISQQGFSTDEGYTSEGFKNVSREVEKEDISIKIRDDDVKDSDTIKTIKKILNASSNYLNINILNVSEYVILETNKLMLSGSLLPSKEVYEKKMKKKKEKKKYESYEIISNRILIITTMAFLLISIQKSIPEIKSKKTHPGCKLSFAGYPLGNSSDKSGILYISCVLKSIQANIKPWNSIKNIDEESLVSNIEEVITFILQEDKMINKLLENKRDYLKTAPLDDIPEEHSIKRWEEFLPPLNEIENGIFQNVSPKLIKDLENYIKTGSSKQEAHLAVVRSKMTYGTMEIIKKIQNIVSDNVKKNNAILINRFNEPFLINGCCEGKSETTNEYFTRLDPTIVALNDTIRDINFNYMKTKKLSRGAFFFYPDSTRRPKINVSNEYDDNIFYLLLNSLLKKNLEASEEPFFSLQKEYIDNDKKIEWFKSKNIMPSKERLEEIINILNHKNNIKINKNNEISIHTNVLARFSSVEKTSKHSILFESFVDILTLEISDELKKENLRTFRENITKENKALEEKIISFIQKYSKTKKQDEAILQLKQILQFTSRHDNYHKIFGFIQNIIRDLSIVLPLRILYQKEISNETIKIHKHWKLSDLHMKDIKNILMKHYESMNRYIGNPEFNKILETFIEKNEILNELAYNIRFIHLNLDEKDEKRTITMLYHYFILSIFDNLLDCVHSDSEYESFSMIHNESVADWIIDNINYMENEKKSVDYDYKKLKEKINRSKEKEKDIMTTKLQDMTDEKRAVNNLFKKHKLEEWGVGEQKGFKVYQQDTYDKERGELEKQILNELKLDKMDGVTKMNRDIYMIEMEIQEAEAKEIEEEEYDISHIGEDNDGYGEYDGEEM